MKIDDKASDSSDDTVIYKIYHEYNPPPYQAAFNSAQHVAEVHISPPATPTSERESDFSIVDTPDDSDSYRDDGDYILINTQQHASTQRQMTGIFGGGMSPAQTFEALALVSSSSECSDTTASTYSDETLTDVKATEHTSKQLLSHAIIMICMLDLPANRFRYNPTRNTLTFSFGLCNPNSSLAKKQHHSNSIHKTGRT
jgi:hypothetical protein